MGCRRSRGICSGKGEFDEFFRLHQRGGKSAGVNLAIGAARGEIVVIADIDTTFDRDAVAIMLEYFADPTVGAVSGNLGVRNASTNLITRGQAIEYAIGLALGRRIADALGILTIVSGAFGAFRRDALESIGRQDVEVGEDADLTMKLRRAGWRIRFAPDARALTDVPDTVSALIGQRLRWDRGLITIWSRKYVGALDPRQSSFRLMDAIALMDVVGFQIVLALAFPVYIVWLIYYFGDLSPILIGATLAGYVVLDAVSFAAAAAVRTGLSLRLLPYLPFYTLMQISIMRVVRIVAIVQELIFRSSYRDFMCLNELCRSWSEYDASLDYSQYPGWVEKSATRVPSKFDPLDLSWERPRAGSLAGGFVLRRPVLFP